MKRPMMTAGSEREKATSLPGGREVVGVIGEQHQGREGRGADGIALGDRLGRVADRIERIGDVAHLLRQARHLRDAAGVIGDRAVRIERDDHAGHRQHGGGGDRDAVEAEAGAARPPSLYEAQIARHTAITGSAVAFMETPRPAMMLVA